MSDRYSRPETVRVFNQQDCDGEWMPSGLAAAIKWLSDKLDEVPAPYRETATIRINSVSNWEDSHSANIEIAYQRPATPGEIATRKSVAREEAERALTRARRRAAAGERRLAALAAEDDA